MGLSKYLELVTLSLSQRLYLIGWAVTQPYRSSYLTTFQLTSVWQMSYSFMCTDWSPSQPGISLIIVNLRQNHFQFHFKLYADTKASHGFRQYK